MKTHQNPIIEDVSDDELEHKYDTAYYAPEIENPTSANNPSTLEIYDANLAAQQVKLFQASIKQQTKVTDDSRTAYGESAASSFGQRGIAPLPEPSAPPLEDDDWREYQAWMHAPTHADRSRFKNHQRWSNILNQGQAQFKLENNNELKDTISADFRNKVLAGEYKELLQGTGIPETYAEMQDYVPRIFSAQNHIDRANGYIDQVQEMMDFTDQHFKTSYFKGKFTGQEIPSNKFYVVSDHNGDNTGKNLQIWGPGVKQGLSWASNSSKQSLGRVHNSQSSYDVSTNYEHVNNRFTIIRINDNERGFVLDRASNQISKMRPGRYVVSEKEFSYIGKASLNFSNNVLPVAAHTRDQTITYLANQLQLVFVTQGKVAFMKDFNKTYTLYPRPEPYILDKRRGETFISYQNSNQQVIRDSENTFTKINELQPGQFVVFQHLGKTIVWQYDAENPHLNTLYLSNNNFNFDGKIHNINESHFAVPNAHIINLKPGQAMVVRDSNQQIRFVEGMKPQMFVLRTPLEFIDVISQNKIEFRYGSQEEGNEIVRLMLRSSEWVSVVDRTGHLAFYPPRLDNQPYYFLQPEHTVVKVINKNTAGETPLEVPGIGKVSVVNIPSGSIGACRLHNMHFFLNPSDVPYVFVPPDFFIKIIDSKLAHQQIEDLHRIVLKPEERAIVSKDGKLYRLPALHIEDNAALSEENGVYVFRSFQFEVYGPVNKSEKSYRLGPIQYFNVGVGEVAYGTMDKKLRIWEAGEHSVDNRKNEWFTDFFETNIDPVDIKDLSVTFKHGITGTVGVFVSYHIANPEKAITHFKDHKNLHQFIHKTTQSEMIRLCASRPPLGYTELYFSATETRNPADGISDASKAVDEIEKSFMDHAAALLHEYGVQISKMYIDSWTLAPDFVSQVQNNAKKLQDQHAQVEQTRMSLQQSKLENDQKIQRQTAELQLKELENQRIKLEQEAIRLKQTGESQTKAEIKVQQAKADAAAQIESAKAQAESQIENSKAIASSETSSAEAKANASIVAANAKLKIQVQEATGKAEASAAQAKMENEININRVAAEAKIAEQEAVGRTAAQRIESETLAQIATNKFNAKKMEIEAKKLDINTTKEQGMIEAAITAAKEQAKYAGLSPEQRLELQKAEIYDRNMTRFIHMMLKTGVQFPGSSIDGNVLQALSVPRIATLGNNSQTNFATPVVMFSPPQLPNSKIGNSGNASIQSKTIVEDELSDSEIEYKENCYLP